MSDVFFIVSKTLALLAAPAQFAVGLSVLGAGLLFTRWHRLARAIAATGAISLVIVSATPLPKIAIRPLEARFPEFIEDGRRIDGLIVLGGIGLKHGRLVFYDTSSRLAAALDLALRHPEAKLVLSGGSSELVADDRNTEADAAATLFKRAGIPSERLLLENGSRNTRENALLTRRLVVQQPGERWLLITSAFHMPRAIGCFRAVGLNLEPYPVDFRTDLKTTDFWEPFSSFLLGMRVANLAANEWVGLLVYRMAGYTDEFLPAPSPAIRAQGGRWFRIQHEAEHETSNNGTTDDELVNPK